MECLFNIQMLKHFELRYLELTLKRGGEELTKEPWNQPYYVSAGKPVLQVLQHWISRKRLSLLPAPPKTNLLLVCYCVSSVLCLAVRTKCRFSPGLCNLTYIVYAPVSIYHVCSNLVLLVVINGADRCSHILRNILQICSWLRLFSPLVLSKD